MALSLSEQLQIMDGDVNPSTKPVLYLVKQASISKAIEFQNSHKVPSVNTHANDYVLKMKKNISKIFANDFAFMEQVTRATINIFGNGAILMTDIQAYNESQFLDLINNSVYQAMEVVSGICHEEKTEYDSM